MAEVRRLISVSSGDNRQQAKELLQAILARVVELQKEFERVYGAVVAGLAKRGIYMINEAQLDERQAEFVQSYFTARVLPELEPILLRDNQEMPVLNDESIYLAVDIKSSGDYNYAVVEVPTDRLTRFVEIPPSQGARRKSVYCTG